MQKIEHRRIPDLLVIFQHPLNLAAFSTRLHNHVLEKGAYCRRRGSKGANRK